MTTDDDEPPQIFKLCEAARIDAGALGAVLVLFADDGEGHAVVSFAWDGSNACHSVAAESLRTIADAMEQQERKPH